MPKVNFISASQTNSLMVDGRIRPPFGRGAITYARQLARDILGIEKEEFDSKDIDRGNDLEDEAIEFFEGLFFTSGERPEFIVHPEIEHFGGTPDWKCDEFGIDIKCPNQKNHHDNLVEGVQLSKYEHQFQSYMAITGLDRWGLASYNKAFPDNTKMAIAWMERDQAYIDKLLDRVQKFWPVVEDELQKLQSYQAKL